MNTEEVSRNSEKQLGSDSLQVKRKSDSVGENNKRHKRAAPEKAQRGFTGASFDEAEYYFDKYLRKVYPYYFTYKTFCKGRWVGKRLIDVFSEEFRAHSEKEFEKNITEGNIKINGETITCDYVLKENDCITNKVHRHEIAVLASPIKIIHSSDELIVIDKPPSIPVHPCGRYRHNSLIFILAKEYNLNKLYSVHRLDRLTSGLIVFAKTIKKSQEINEAIRDRKVHKEYVCRVEGNFPDNEVSCKEPIEVISHKMGICMVSPSGKDCHTEFKKLSHNGTSSVVLCKPFTGRMHQIRVHLQYLGHPILNDPIYNHAHAFGPLKGKNGDFGKTKEQLLEDLLNTHNLKKWLLEDYTDVAIKKDPEESLNDSKENRTSLKVLEDDTDVAITKDPEESLKNSKENRTSLKVLEDDTGVAIKKDPEESLNDSKENRTALKVLEYYTKCDGWEELAHKYVKDEKKITLEAACDLCHQKYMDPEPKDMLLFLHSLRYKGENWEFESMLPAWAKDDWEEN